MSEEKPKPAAPAAPPAKPAAAPAAPPPPEEPSEDLKLIRDAVRQFAGDAVLDHTVFRGELTMRIDRSRVVDVCRFLRDEHKFNFLSDLCGAHYPGRERPFEVVYHLYSIQNKNYVRLKIWLADEEPAPSVAHVWSTANWHEREAYDMFGIRFDGHPDLKRILLPDDWKGFPLRKDYPMEGRGDYPALPGGE